MQNKANILLIDIETAPILAWVWGLFKQNVGLDQIKRDWYMLCYAAKWYKKKGIIKDAIWLHKAGYKRSKIDDRTMLSSLWSLLDKADIVVAHNGDRFDAAKINAKFFQYGMPPPSPYKIVDTLKVARANFRFSSNRLDYIVRLKAFGSKLKTDFELWVDVMAGNKAQCKRMLDYNEHDVEILEPVYEAMLPWITNHPNLGLYSDSTDPACPKCGSKDIQYRGYAYTNTSKFHKFVCNDCGGWGRMAINQLSTEKRKGLARNVSK